MTHEVLLCDSHMSSVEFPSILGLYSGIILVIPEEKNVKRAVFLIDFSGGFKL